MNAETIHILIYFVGIAAIIDRPIDGKSVIFPVARQGIYQATPLEPHETMLHLRGQDLAEAEDPEEYCASTLGGTWNGDDQICTLGSLRGATLRVDAAEELSFDESFNAIPRFRERCSHIVTAPKRVYSDGADPDFVAARYEVTGGTLSGCNRKEGAFVTKLNVRTTDGVLVIERGGQGLRRIRLRQDAVLALENRPLQHHQHDGKAHYGWYYFIAAGDLPCPVSIPTKASITLCGKIPGVVDPTTLPSASGPDCGNTIYP